MNLPERQHAPGFKWGGDPSEFKMWVLPTYVCRSLDEGKTWSEPILLNRPWCGCIHSMIELESGRIVLVGQEVIPQWRHATVMFVSGDEGQTWRRSNVLDIGQGRHDHAGSIEGTIVQRRDGSLYQLLRTETGWLYESTSADGIEWTDMRQSPLRSVTCWPSWDGFPTDESRCCGTPLPEIDPIIAPVARNSRFLFPTTNAGRGRHRSSSPSITERGVAFRIRISRTPAGRIVDHDDAGKPADESGRRRSRSGRDPDAPKHNFGSDYTRWHRHVRDSTTAERPGSVESVYAERVQEQLHRLGSSLLVYNAGVGSNTTVLARQRFANDVLKHQPKIVVIQFGLNDAAVDVWKTPPAATPRVSLADYEENLRWMVETARDKGIRPVLMTTNPLRWIARTKEPYGRPPYSPDEPDGFDKPVLTAYNACVRDLASELKVPVVDIHSAFSKRNPDELLLDGMHPNDDGHALITELLLPVIREQVSPR